MIFVLTFFLYKIFKGQFSSPEAGVLVCRVMVNRVGGSPGLVYMDMDKEHLSMVWYGHPKACLPKTFLAEKI